MSGPGGLVLVAVLVLATAASAGGGEAPLRWVREEGHLHHYTGTARLDGIVERRTHKEVTALQGDPLCFFAHGPTSVRVPRGRGDTRLPWFCFDDRAAAVAALKLPEQPAAGTCGYRVTATVVIGNYVANRQEGEVFDTATLLAVHRRGRTVTPIACD